MRFWVINREVVSGGPSPYEVTMFHGVATRGGKDALDFLDRSLKNVLAHPLSISRNVFSVPQLTLPWGACVISDRLRRSLPSHPNVHYRPASITRAAYVPWRRGEPNHPLENLWIDECNESWHCVFETLEHQPDLLNRVEPQWEIVVPLYVEVVAAFGEGRSVTVHHPSLPRNPLMDFAGQLMTISAGLFVEFPVLCCGPGWAIRDDLFEVLSPGIDREFIAAEAYEI